MTQWQKVRIGDFLFERKEKYDPNDEKIAGLGRINKIDFSGNLLVGSKGKLKTITRINFKVVPQIYIGKIEKPCLSKK